MMGYSDSVRDGSSFTSDAQIANTSVELMNLEDQLNQGVDSSQKVCFPAKFFFFSYFRFPDSFFFLFFYVNFNLKNIS